MGQTAASRVEPPGENMMTAIFFPRPTAVMNFRLVGLLVCPACQPVTGLLFSVTANKKPAHIKPTSGLY
jgi:hypothetical protein